MHRFFLPPEDCAGPTVLLSESDSHHAARVLRIRPGDPIEILDGIGHRLGCRVSSIDRGTVCAEVRTRSNFEASPFTVTLAPALVKHKAMDFILQKATELGAGCVAPIITARTVIEAEPDRQAHRLASWRQTAIESCKQCGNPWLPELHPPVHLAEFLARRAGQFLLVASLRPDTRSFRQWLSGDVAAATRPVLLVGPEGDFTAEEDCALREAGARPVALGPLVLRTETAALAGLAILLYELRLAHRIAD